MNRCGGQARTVDCATACGGLHQVSELPAIFIQDCMPEQDETPVPLAAQAICEFPCLGCVQGLHHHGYIQTSISCWPNNSQMHIKCTQMHFSYVTESKFSFKDKMKNFKSVFLMLC